MTTKNMKCPECGKIIQVNDGVIQTHYEIGRAMVPGKTAKIFPASGKVTNR